MKKLILRVDLLKYSANAPVILTDFFQKYFTNVTIVDINQQRNEILEFQKTCQYKLISLDKFIPLEHNIDISRVFNINGKYQYHNIKFNGYIAKKEHVIIYDHDTVGGQQIRMLTALLQERGCTVHTKFFYDLSNVSSENRPEILDLVDFSTSGLMVDLGNQLTRIPYFTNPEILESRASIPKEEYLTFKNELISILDMITL